MNSIVVAASVAAKWFVQEEFSKEALSLLAEENELHVPDYFLIEMDSLFCKWIRRHLVTTKEASEIRESLRQFPLRQHSFLHFLDSAFTLANSTQASPYDCLYLATAIFLNGTFITADKLFYDRIRDSSYKKQISWIGKL